MRPLFFIPATTALLISIFGVHNLYANPRSDNALADDDLGKTDIVAGVQVYKERCVQCHGRYGLGNGFQALATKDYPSTNLLLEAHSQTLDNVRSVIRHSMTKHNTYSRMPPWDNELSNTAIDAVSQLIHELRNNARRTFKIIDSQPDVLKPTLNIGRIIYTKRCTQCHGTEGRGDGRMIKIINRPAPYDLTKSILHDNDLQKIINSGGKSQQRSGKMPPWGEELTDTEIDSVIIYIKQLRTDS